jgi:hypothetical protein
MAETEFLGRPLSYWMHLKKTIESHPGGLELSDLIQENASLRAKVSYYESLIERANNYRTTVKTP